jgi:hypothetical protein
MKAAHSPTIESLQTEIKDLKQMIQSLNTLFKASLREQTTMVSHIASATSGFWEISVPYDNLRFIRNAQSFNARDTLTVGDQEDYFYLTSAEKVRLRNRLEKIQDAPINYFEYTLAVGDTQLRLQGRCVEWDSEGLPTKLIGIYIELPKEKTFAGLEEKTVIICSQCREFKGNELEWDILEDFMLARFGLKVSCGLCPHCAGEDV